LFILQSISGNFLGIFCDFSSIFRAFKTISRFFGIVFALKINSKKTKLYPSLPGRARRPDLSRPAQSERPCGAQLGPVAGQCSRRAWLGHPWPPGLCLGVRATASACCTPIKGEAKPPCAACPSPRALAAHGFSSCRAACARAEPSAAAAGVDFRRFAEMERLQVKTTTP
jgi:hypothetical protein